MSMMGGSSSTIKILIAMLFLCEYIIPETVWLVKAGSFNHSRDL
jgi:hypothetical protein